MRLAVACIALLGAASVHGPAGAHDAARDHRVVPVAQAASAPRPAVAGPGAAARPEPASAQTAPQPEPPLRTVPVAPGLWMLVGNGGNVAVSAGTDGIFIVDDQFAPSAPRIVEAIAALQPGPVRFVINTHWHGDHTGGNEAFGSRGAVIVAHDNVRKRMSVPQFIRAFDRETPAAPPAALPVVTFAEAVTLHLNGDEIRVVHVEPAHTDGDAIVHFVRANAIHAGDLYFNGSYPFIDVSSGGGIRGMIRAADRILALAGAETRIIPGHGPLSNAAELREYRAMLQTVADRVAALIAQGRGAEDVVAAKPTAEFDAKWGRGFLPAERWLPIVYSDLVREGAKR